MLAHFDRARVLVLQYERCVDQRGRRLARTDFPEIELGLWPHFKHLA